MLFNANKCIILGCGYVGKHFLSSHPSCFFTQRTDIKDSNKGIKFDLLNKDTWKNLKDSDFVLWTFALSNPNLKIDLISDFYNLYCKNKKVIILSSTSAYQLSDENLQIDEDFPLQIEDQRYIKEEHLRKMGALILHLSGIIGPNRYPKKWYIEKRVKFGKNILNYIHVNDIVYFIEKIFSNFTFCERFNLTSGDFKTHIDIANSLGIQNCFEFLDTTKGSKLIKNKKLVHYLKEENYKFLKYPEDCEVNL
ncbi:hypothetical protein ACWNT8_04610 [Pigmentibacter ruber]